MKVLLHPSSAQIQTGRLMLFPAIAAVPHAGPDSLISAPSPSTLDFQYQTVNLNSPPMATTLRNRGKRSLTVAAVGRATGIYARASSAGTRSLTLSGEGAQGNAIFKNEFE